MPPVLTNVINENTVQMTKEELEYQINSFTVQLKKEQDDRRYGELWEKRLQLKEQLKEIEK